MEKKFISRHSHFLRAISFFMAVAFIVQDLAHASGDSVASSPHPAVLDRRLTVPAEYGMVRKTVYGPEQDLIINIEDAHQKLGAQQSIARILDSLVKNYDLRLVTLEGASDVVDTSIVSSFPVEGVRKKAGEYLLREGRISAGEFYSIVSENQVRLYGAEDEKLYKENVEVFKRLVDAKQDIRAELQGLRAALRELEDRVYSPELKDITSNRLLHKNGEIKFTEYWLAFGRLASRARVSYAKYPNLRKLARAIRLERQIDFARAGTERESLMRDLEKVLSRPRLEKLVFNAIRYKQNKMTAAAFHRVLFSIAGKKRINAAGFLNLRLYGRYAALYDGIDLLAVFDEVERFESQIRNKFFRNTDEKELSRLTCAAAILSRLLDTGLSGKDYEVLKADPAAYDLDAVQSAFLSLCRKYGLTRSEPVRFDFLKSQLPDARKFYELASDRNQALLQNTLKRMKKECVHVAAVITGGFHTEGISRLMDEEKLSYLVVMPKFDEKSPDRPYITVLTKKPKEYEQMFKDSDFYLAITSSVDTANPNPQVILESLAAAIAATPRVYYQARDTLEDRVFGLKQSLIEETRMRFEETNRGREKRLLGPSEFEEILKAARIVMDRQNNPSVYWDGEDLKKGIFSRLGTEAMQFKFQLTQEGAIERQEGRIERAALNRSRIPKTAEATLRQASTYDVKVFLDEFLPEVTRLAGTKENLRGVREKAAEKMERFERAKGIRFNDVQRRKIFAQSGKLFFDEKKSFSVARGAQLVKARHPERPLSEVKGSEGSKASQRSFGASLPTGRQAPQDDGSGARLAVQVKPLGFLKDAVIRSFPELTALTVLSVFAGPAGIGVFSVITAALAIRLFLGVSTFVHGFGHAFFKFLISRDPLSLSLSKILEGVHPAQFLKTLLPFQKLLPFTATPSLIKVDEGMGKWALRFWASGGIFMNLLTVSVFTVLASVPGFEPLSDLLAFFWTAAIFAAFSPLDFVALVTGFASYLACGPAVLSINDDLPHFLEGLSSNMPLIQYAATRGSQSYGFSIRVYNTNTGRIEYRDSKALKPKRVGIAEELVDELKRVIRKAIREGCVVPAGEKLTIIFHLRWATSGESTIHNAQPHGHEGAVRRKEFLVRTDNGKPALREVETNDDPKLVHNGDADNFKIEIYDNTDNTVKKLNVPEKVIREFLGLTMPDNVFHGDSDTQTLARWFGFVLTRGLVYKSARWTYFDFVSDLIKMNYETGEIYVSDSAYASPRDIERWSQVIAKTVRKVEKELGPAFFDAGAASLGQISQEARKKLKEEIAEALTSHGVLRQGKGWTEKNVPIFAEKFVEAFLDHDIAWVKREASTSLDGAFALISYTTREPRLGIFKLTQNVSVMHNRDTGAVFLSAEPKGALAAVAEAKETDDIRRMTFGDGQFGVLKLGKDEENPLVVYDHPDHHSNGQAVNGDASTLHPAQIKWTELRHNPLIKFPDRIKETDDWPLEELRDIPRAIQEVVRSFDENEDRLLTHDNNLPMIHLSRLLMAKADEWRERQETLSAERGGANGRPLYKSPDYDVIFAGSGFHVPLAEHMKATLEGASPLMHVGAMDLGHLLRLFKREKRGAHAGIGPKTVIIFLSNSGQTQGAISGLSLADQIAEETAKNSGSREILWQTALDVAIAMTEKEYALQLWEMAESADRKAVKKGLEPRQKIGKRIQRALQAIVGDGLALAAVESVGHEAVRMISHLIDRRMNEEGVVQSQAGPLARQMVEKMAEAIAEPGDPPAPADKKVAARLVERIHRGLLFRNRHMVSTQEFDNSLSEIIGQAYDKGSPVQPTTFITGEKASFGETKFSAIAAEHVLLTEIALGLIKSLLYEAVLNFEKKSLKDSNNKSELAELKKKIARYADQELDAVLREAAMQEEPWPFDLQKNFRFQDIRKFREQEKSYYEEIIPEIIGYDAEGHEIPASPERQELIKEANFRAQNVTEWVKAYAIFSVAYIFFIVAVLHAPLFNSLVGKFIGVFPASILDGLLYLAGGWLTTLGIRWWEGRPMRSRLGSMHHVFSGPGWIVQIIANNARALFSNAYGFLTPVFHAAEFIGGALHFFQRILVRGTDTHHITPDHRFGPEAADDADSANTVAGQYRGVNFNGPVLVNQMVSEGSVHADKASTPDGRFRVTVLPSPPGSLPEPFTMSQSMQDFAYRRLGMFKSLIAEQVINYLFARQVSESVGNIVRAFFFFWPALGEVVVGYLDIAIMWRLGTTASTAIKQSTRHPENASTSSLPTIHPRVEKFSRSREKSSAREEELVAVRAPKGARLAQERRSFKPRVERLEDRDQPSVANHVPLPLPPDLTPSLDYQVLWTAESKDIPAPSHDQENSALNTIFSNGYAMSPEMQASVADYMRQVFPNGHLHFVNGTGSSSGPIDLSRIFEDDAQIGEGTDFAEKGIDLEDDSALDEAIRQAVKAIDEGVQSLESIEAVPLNSIFTEEGKGDQAMLMAEGLFEDEDALYKAIVTAGGDVLAFTQAVPENAKSEDSPPRPPAPAPLTIFDADELDTLLELSPAPVSTARSVRAEFALPAPSEFFNAGNITARYEEDARRLTVEIGKEPLSRLIAELKTSFGAENYAELKAHIFLEIVSIEEINGVPIETTIAKISFAELEEKIESSSPGEEVIRIVKEGVVLSEGARIEIRFASDTDRVSVPEDSAENTVAVKVKVTKDSDESEEGEAEGEAPEEEPSLAISTPSDQAKMTPPSVNSRDAGNNSPPELKAQDFEKNGRKGEAPGIEEEDTVRKPGPSPKPEEGEATGKEAAPAEENLESRDASSDHAAAQPREKTGLFDYLSFVLKILIVAVPFTAVWLALHFVSGTRHVCSFVAKRLRTKREYKDPYAEEERVREAALRAKKELEEAIEDAKKLDIQIPPSFTTAAQVRAEIKRVQKIEKLLGLAPEGVDEEENKRPEEKEAQHEAEHYVEPAEFSHGISRRALEDTLEKINKNPDQVRQAAGNFHSLYDKKQGVQSGLTWLLGPLFKKENPSQPWLPSIDFKEAEQAALGYLRGKSDPLLEVLLSRIMRDGRFKGDVKINEFFKALRQRRLESLKAGMPKPLSFKGGDGSSESIPMENRKALEILLPQDNLDALDILMGARMAEQSQGEKELRKDYFGFVEKIKTAVIKLDTQEGREETVRFFKQWVAQMSESGISSDELDTLKNRALKLIEKYGPPMTEPLPLPPQEGVATVSLAGTETKPGAFFEIFSAKIEQAGALEKLAALPPQIVDAKSLSTGQKISLLKKLYQRVDRLTGLSKDGKNQLLDKISQHRSALEKTVSASSAWPAPEQSASTELQVPEPVSLTTPDAGRTQFLSVRKLVSFAAILLLGFGAVYYWTHREDFSIPRIAFVSSPKGIAPVVSPKTLPEIKATKAGEKPVVSPDTKALEAKIVALKDEQANIQKQITAAETRQKNLASEAGDFSKQMQTLALKVEAAQKELLAVRGKIKEREAHAEKLALSSAEIQKDLEKIRVSLREAEVSKKAGAQNAIGAINLAPHKEKTRTLIRYLHSWSPRETIPYRQQLQGLGTIHPTTDVWAVNRYVAPHLSVYFPMKQSYLQHVKPLREFTQKELKEANVVRDARGYWVPIGHGTRHRMEGMDDALAFILPDMNGMIRLWMVTPGLKLSYPNANAGPADKVLSDAADQLKKLSQQLKLLQDNEQAYAKETGVLKTQADLNEKEALKDAAHLEKLKKDHTARELELKNVRDDLQKKRAALLSIQDQIRDLENEIDKRRKGPASPGSPSKQSSLLPAKPVFAAAVWISFVAGITALFSKNGLLYGAVKDIKGSATGSSDNRSLEGLGSAALFLLTASASAGAFIFLHTFGVPLYAGAAGLLTALVAYYLLDKVFGDTDEGQLAPKLPTPAVQLRTSETNVQGARLSIYPVTKRALFVLSALTVAAVALFLEAPLYASAVAIIASMAGIGLAARMFGDKIIWTAITGVFLSIAGMFYSMEQSLSDKPFHHLHGFNPPADYVLEKKEAPADDDKDQKNNFPGLGKMNFEIHNPFPFAFKDKEEDLLNFRKMDPQIEKILKALEVRQRNDLVQLNDEIQRSFRAIGATGRGGDRNFNAANVGTVITAEQLRRYREVERISDERQASLASTQGQEKIESLFGLLSDAKVERTHQAWLIGYSAHYYSKDQRIVRPLMEALRKLDTDFPDRDKRNSDIMRLYTERRAAIVGAFRSVGESALQSLLDYRRETSAQFHYSRVAEDLLIAELSKDAPGLAPNPLYKRVVLNPAPAIFNRHRYYELPGNTLKRSELQSMEKASADVSQAGPVLGLSAERFDRDIVQVFEKGYGREVDDLMNHPDKRIRANVARYLGLSGDPHYMPFILWFLKDSEPEVRLEAARTLGKFKTTQNANSADPKLLAIVEALSNHKNDSDRLVRGQLVLALSTLGDTQKAIWFLGLILNHDKHSDPRTQNIAAVLPDATERKAAEELRRSLESREEHPHVRLQALKAISQLNAPEAFDAAAAYLVELHEEKEIWWHVLFDRSPEAENAEALLRYLVEHNKENALIKQVLMDRLRKSYEGKRPGDYLMFLSIFKRAVDAETFNKYVHDHRWNIHILSAHLYWTHTWNIWLIVLASIIGVELLLGVVFWKSEKEKQIPDPRGRKPNLGEASSNGQARGARLAATRPPVASPLPTGRQGPVRGLRSPRFALVIETPKNASVREFARRYHAHFVKSLGPAAPRFEMHYMPEGYAARFLKRENTVAILDSTSVTHTDTVPILLRKLNELDEHSFRLLYPFVQKLAHPSGLENLSREEQEILLTTVEQSMPEPMPRRVFLTSEGAFVQPEVVTNESDAAEESSGILAKAFDRTLADIVLKVRPSAAPALKNIAGAFAGYLAPAHPEEGRSVFEKKTAALVESLSSQHRLRYAMADPSYQDTPASPTFAGQTPKTLVTALGVFTKDGAGVPWSLRMEYLEKKAPGLFRHVLWVTDEDIHSREELLRKYPQAAVFGENIIFAPSAKTLEEIYRAKGGAPIDDEFIVLTAKPGVLSSQKPDKALRLKEAIVLSLDEASPSTISFMETGTKLILNPDYLPRYVFRLSDGSLVFRLPKAVPLGYLLENARVQQETVETAA